MEFEFDEEQLKLIDGVARTVRGWTASPDEFFTLERWRECGALGLLGLSVPEELGGGGHSAVTTAALVESFASHHDDMGLVFAASAHLFACVMPIVEHGGSGLRERTVPKLVSGAWVGANAISESGAGSDVTALETTAVRDGDHYVLNGRKSFVSNGPVADQFCVYAMTDPAARHLGVSAFVVPRDAPGLTVGSPFGKLGLSGCPAGTVEFTDCRVPAANLIGVEGQGAAIFQSSMRWERSCLLAGYLGLLRRLVDRCVAHVRQRHQFGRALAANQSLVHRIVEMRTSLDVSRLLLYRACWEMDQGDSATLSVAMAKLTVSESVVAAANEAVQLFGGDGYRTEAGIERALRDAMPSRIFSGTSEIQRELIAKEMGL
ncbi:acyl-CoA dehydrogenase family protein [Streptomyces sulphureus]|uniref:acyl-CoA dehydrogenase family protein n=1 Tax=Streptomyces sulphureus TaxID=47758 RepID=UPI00036461DF|nr:acyl-CoA dehydrogenase family protein [Streptomyces sulphureus]